MGLQRLLFEFYQIGQDLEVVLKKIIKQNEGKIVGLVKNRLYQYGVDGTGRKITPTYSPSTIKRKKEQGKRSSHVTLRDEGLFYDGFYLELNKYDVILSSSDDKTSYLLDKYGQAILHFTKQEKDFILNEIIDPGLEDVIKKAQRNSSSAGGDIDVDLF